MNKNAPPDDGCRHMPKLKCPYGNHRFADVPDVAFRNELELRRLKENEVLGYGDSIHICPICRNKVVFSVKILRHPTVRVAVSAHTI